MGLEPSGVDAGRVASRRRTALVAVGLIVVLGIGGGYLWWRSGRRLHGWDDGALRTGLQSNTGMPLLLGETGAYGVTVLTNTSRDTVTLEAVRIRPPLEEGAELVAVHAVGPHRQTGLVGMAQEWPPAKLAGALRPVAGFRLPSARTDPAADVNIVFGVKVTRPGHYGWAEFDVDYRVGGRKYTARIENALVACAAEGPTRPECDRNLADVLEDRLR